MAILNIFDRHPLLAAFVFTASCLGAGAAIAIFLLPGGPSETELRLNSIEQRLDALEETLSELEPVSERR